MKIKKFFASLFLIMFFFVKIVSAEDVPFDKPSYSLPPVFGFTVCEKSGFFQNSAFLQTQGGIFLSNNPCLPDIGAILGVLDYEIFADYSFKTDCRSIYDNTIEAGVSVSVLLFNVALVPVWYLDDSTFNFDYRIGSRIGKYGNQDVLSHFGSEIFAYFQAPFTSIEDFELSLGMKLRIVPQKI